MQVHYSSKTDDWATPQSFFDEMDAEFSFDLDVCASADNAKASRFLTKEDDALSQTWSGTCWMNPPYGRGIGAWIKKAYETAASGHTVVCLIPSRTDTSWWHRYCAKSTDIRFVSGRLSFGNGDGRAPFPSVVVVFDGKRTKQQFLADNVDQVFAGLDAELAEMEIELDRLDRLLVA